MTRSMTRKHNHDDAFRIMAYDNGGVAPWPDLNHDILVLVMIQLGVFDIIAFSGVCKSWRSFVLTNRNNFLGSKPPISISISPEKVCCLEDFEGRKFKTILPHSDGRTCVGLTSGYLILYGEKTHDFWLVNPFTRHELHFPDVTFDVYHDYGSLRAILVFSPSKYEWVFVISNNYSLKIRFSIAGKGTWTCISTPVFIKDIHAFKGRIYTLHFGYRLSEMILYPQPKLMLLQTKDFPGRGLMLPQFVRSGEKLYLIDHLSVDSEYPFMIHELDFGEMKWVSREKTIPEYALFFSEYMLDVVMQELWVHPRSQYVRYALSDTSAKDFSKDRLFYANMWYFINDTLNVNLLHE